MWCIPKLTPEFRERMEDVLALYERPHNPDEPVICLDEKSLQLLAHVQKPLVMKVGKTRREDYEYVRHGTRNIFVAVEPKAGIRQVGVTTRRKKKDLAKFVRMLLNGAYRHASLVHLVLDNLNTHNASSFHETFGKEEAERLLKRIRFHHTPKHASWLNMAEIEIGILSRQCLKQRFEDEQRLKTSVRAWKQERNRHRATIIWKFTRQDAEQTFPVLYKTKLV